MLQGKSFPHGMNLLQKSAFLTKSLNKVPSIEKAAWHELEILPSFGSS
jgi:hypothetical protein